MVSLTPTRPAASALERPPPTARRLAAASLAPNTRRAYSGALRRLDAWLDGRPLEDASLAAYLAELHDQGRAPASASTAVAAACFRARLAHEPSPAGERTARVLAGADRRRPRPRADTGVRGGGPGRRPRHLPPAAAPRPRRRVRPRRPRARPPRRRDRRTPLHGRDAAERGQRPPLGRRRRRGRRRRGAGHRPPEQDEPGGRDDGRPVREGRRRPRFSGRCGPRRARRPRTASCRSRRRWWGCGSRRRPGPPASSG